MLSQVDVRLKKVELVVYNDGSTDGSLDILRTFEEPLSNALGRVLILHSSDGPSGVGSARNRACEKALAGMFVFLDADDVMRPHRLARSLRAFGAVQNGQSLARVGVIGGNFDRIPPGSTPRYENYHRQLTTQNLMGFAFRDSPLAMPTIACLKEVWEKVGGFVEGLGVAEDLHFLYAAIENEYQLHKLDGDSITGYRYHDQMTSNSLHRRDLLTVRVQAFERIVLKRENWSRGFSIWNCGRDGKDCYKRLSAKAQALVLQWGDVHPRKIGTFVFGKPVVHFSKLKAPVVLCVAMDRGGDFEANVASLGLRGGEDYFHLV